MHEAPMLDARWVERIFTRMLVRYGTAWTRMWEGVEPEAVKADWSRELAQCPGHAIGYALEHLPPERPPTVTQFRALCSQRPDSAVKLLSAPRADPARVGEALRVMRANLTVATRTGGRLAWAEALKAREERGEPLTLEQRRMWREALSGRPTAASGSAIAAGDEFTPPNPANLPPAMRGETP